MPNDPYGVTRTCSHPQCNETIPVEQFACRPDWFALPNPIRNKFTDRKVKRRDAVRAALEWWNQRLESGNRV